MRRRRLEVFGAAQYERTGGRRRIWRRIGVAFENEDGSINVLLDFIPTDPKGIVLLRHAPRRRR